MTRRISSILLTAVALTTLSACDASSVNPTVRGAQLEAPTQQGSDDGSLFMKWLTRPPGGVNGLKGSGD
jgi:hypothetical protein